MQFLKFKTVQNSFQKIWINIKIEPLSSEVIKKVVCLKVENRHVENIKTKIQQERSSQYIAEYDSAWKLIEISGYK